MFKITKLQMFDYNDKTYCYNFSNGINYFTGKNNSGKTEFYKFIDYMFGASLSIKNYSWYKNSLKKATMYFTYNDISYRITRIIPNDKCLFSYEDESDGEYIDLKEYNDRLQSVFSIDKNALEQLHKFTDEKITFRSFTLFNFLGEIRQGVLIDFFDKCSEIKYSTKITPIYNFIFNKNIERIFWLKNEIERLQEDIKQKEQITESNRSIINKVNVNLQKLNIDCVYTGYNGSVILCEVKRITQDLVEAKPASTRNISDLEVICSNIDEQIKVYEKYTSDLRDQQRENKNRKKLLESFESIISQNKDFEYLVKPLEVLSDEIKNSISFSQYMIKDDVLTRLKEQRKKVKDEIMKAEMQLTRYTLNDKLKAAAVAEDCINCFNIQCSDDDLEELKKTLRDYRKELKELQEADDKQKIQQINEQITELYKSAYNVSDFVKDDFNDTNNKFKIKFNKNRNALVTITSDDEGQEMVYGTGSHARHTLIQLCGYLVFLKMLINENKYPIIPIMVIDHISKPFSETNKSAIGTIINKACESVGIDNFQIFMFDDEPCEELCISANHKEDLFDENKSGFNPFLKLTDE